MQSTLPPFVQYSDLSGDALQDGYIYIGAVNQNPETNPITVYWDAAGTQPAAQPIRTINGLPVRNGEAADVFVNSAYSITVRNKTNQIVYSKLANTISIISSFIQTLLDDADAATARATLGSIGGVVRMEYIGGVWYVYGPNGAINTAGTTTQGLQEAITYAYANNFPLEVIDKAVINCTSPIAIPAGFRNRLFIGVDVQLLFGALGAVNLITVDSQENAEVKIKATVTQNNADTGAVFCLKPANVTGAGNITVAASIIEFGTAVPGPNGGGLLIDLTTGGVNGNPRISLDDSNGGTYSWKITNPGTGFITCQENQFYYGYLHGASAFGIQVLTSTVNQVGLRRNNWYCGRLAMKGAASIGFSTYEQYCTYVGLGANNEEGTLDKGAVFQSGSIGCVVVVSKISGAVTANIVDTDGNNLIFESGGIKAGNALLSYMPSGQALFSTTPTGTPASLVETDLQSLTLPANALNKNGRGIRIRAWGTYAANANGKTIKLYFGGVAIVTSGILNSNNVGWMIEAEIYRKGVNAQTTFGNHTAGNSVIGLQSGSQAIAEAAAIIVKVTGQNAIATANDIASSGMVIDFIN